MQLVAHEWVRDAVHRESMAIIKLAQELHAEEGRLATSRVRLPIREHPFTFTHGSRSCNYQSTPRLTCRRSFLSS